MNRQRPRTVQRVITPAACVRPRRLFDTYGNNIIIIIIITTTTSVRSSLYAWTVLRSLLLGTRRRSGLVGVLFYALAVTTVAPSWIRVRAVDDAVRLGQPGPECTSFRRFRPRPERTTSAIILSSESYRVRSTGIIALRDLRVFALNLEG